MAFAIYKKRIEESHIWLNLMLVTLKFASFCIILIKFTLFWLREKEEIWLSPMTEALTPTEKSKKQRDNTIKKNQL